MYILHNTYIHVYIHLNAHVHYMYFQDNVPVPPTQCVGGTGSVVLVNYNPFSKAFWLL